MSLFDMSVHTLEPGTMRLPVLEGCDAVLLQDLFQRVTRHLLTQKAKSKSGSACRYLSEDTGMKCAVGCLICPDAYVATIEGCEADSDEVCRVLEKSGVPMAHRAVLELLSMLQRTHDHEDVEDWPYVLGCIATDNGFEMPCLTH